jgi:hypothetical protein
MYWNFVAIDGVVKNQLNNNNLYTHFQNFSGNAVLLGTEDMNFAAESIYSVSKL